ncbi:MAG: hypothetical protein SVM79_06865 [Chloroflexota bacterium]|nr:hypothetical protein [Chloroflexota bacterium]
MIVSNDDNGHHTGYDELEGDWAVFYKIAGFFVYKVKFEDKEDFLHDLLLEMAKVKAKYEAQGKILREAGLMWVGRYTVLKYWRKQRLWARVFAGSLNKRIEPDGGKTELWEMLADPKALDLDAWVDAEHLLKSYPESVVRVVYKRYYGLAVSGTERALFSFYRRLLGEELSPMNRCRQQEKLTIPTEQVERIRQAYFSGKKPITQIAREFHHDRRTVRKAIRSAPPMATGWPGNSCR